MKKFAIGIPTLNRYDLLLPSLVFYSQKDFTAIDIYVLDNGNQNIKFPTTTNVKIINMPENVGVGKSWNILCEKIFEEHENALILNDDIYLGRKTQDIKEIINGNFIKCPTDWCAFIMPKSVFKKVGKFDECFYPAYYEDKSYEYRMKLNGVKIDKSVALIPFIYRASKTLEKMPEIIEYSKKNKQKYIEMWGGEPEREKFKQPFNHNN